MPEIYVWFEIAASGLPPIYTEVVTFHANNQPSMQKLSAGFLISEATWVVKGQFVGVSEAEAPTHYMYVERPVDG